MLGDEKSMHATFGHTVQVGYSETLFPTDFASVEAFVERIHRVWDSEVRPSFRPCRCVQGSRATKKKRLPRQWGTRDRSECHTVL